MGEPEKRIGSVLSSPRSLDTSFQDARSEGDNTDSPGSDSLRARITVLQKKVEAYGRSYQENKDWHLSFASDIKDMKATQAELAAAAEDKKQPMNKSRAAMISVRLGQIEAAGEKEATRLDLHLPSAPSAATQDTEGAGSILSTPLEGASDRTSIPPRPTAEGAFNFLSDVIGVRAASEANMPASPSCDPGEHPPVFSPNLAVIMSSPGRGDGSSSAQVG